jgi:hypothetical protein
MRISSLMTTGRLGRVHAAPIPGVIEKEFGLDRRAKYNADHNPSDQYESHDL